MCHIILDIISTLLQKLKSSVRKNKELQLQNQSLQKKLYMQRDIEQDHQSVVYALEQKIKELLTRNAELEYFETYHEVTIHNLKETNKRLEEGIDNMASEIRDRRYRRYGLNIWKHNDNLMVKITHIHISNMLILISRSVGGNIFYI